ncbi:MAG: hypothetical protein ACE5EZ_02965 [Thermodesulfobacteriota bacterium]
MPPYETEIINKLDISPDFITDAYDLSAELFGVIDYLRKALENPNYPKYAVNNVTFINTEATVKLKANKMITYEAFINELRSLVPSGETLNGAIERDLDPKFRRWRLEVTDLLDRIEYVGYSVRCNIRNRSFGTDRNATEEYLNDEYKIELQDTLNELCLTIERYESYGTPPVKTLNDVQAQEEKKEAGINMDNSYSWTTIGEEFGITKNEFGNKINFIKDDFQRSIIFRDIKHAYALAKNGFSKPSVILSGAIIEELLRQYLLQKKISPVRNTYDEYIKACQKSGLLKKAIHSLSDSVRHFRNIVHIANEKDKRHSISKATAIGAVTSIFTIANDF